MPYASALARLGALFKLAARHWRLIAKSALALAVAGAFGGFLFAWLGVYNIAASSGHWPVVDLILRFGLENSVKARASNVAPPRLDDPDLVRLGAGHFFAGCAYCHGAPDTPVSPVAASMLPPPPDLAPLVGHWTDQELFRIVKHGIKYAGMPAWPTLRRDDEIWAMVAFLRRLPALDVGGYRALAMGEVDLEPQGGRQLATGEGLSDAVGACARCHGAERGPPSALVPVLHGQPPEMIVAALQAYASRERDSGVMQEAASGLSLRAMRRLADYYAALPPPAAPAAAPVSGEALARGERLVSEGELSRGIPACAGCHVEGALPAYPRLAGQSMRYLEGQLKAWQAGANAASARGAIMAPIALRLSAEQIADVSAYFARLPLTSRPNGAAP